MKASTDRILTKLTKNLWIILGVFLIILGLFIYFPTFIKAAYENNIYDVMEVERITGLSLEKESDDIAGVACKELKKKYEEENEFSNLKFFLFPNARSAKRALKRLASGEHFYKNSVVVTDNSVEGYVAGVCDAEIYEYYYRSGNLIVMTDAVYGCFGTEEELAAMAEDAKAQSERFVRETQWLPTVFKSNK